MASVVFGRSTVAEFGLIRLVTPISLLLLMPAVAGTAAATACDNGARLPLPDPPRAIAARGFWALSWTLLAAGAVNLGVLTNASVDVAASTRNVLIYMALGLLVLRSGFPYLVWLPPLTYMMACMMFGYPQHGRGNYFWWAVVMEQHASPTQMLVVGSFFGAVTLSYALVHSRNAG